ncbi:MAG: hypothetical protein Aurels2KO_36550 [Aureliella sp.]
MSRLILSCILVIAAGRMASSQEAEPDEAPPMCNTVAGKYPVPRLVFLGDSNTYAGRFAAIADAKYQKLMQGRAIQFVNLGVSSETAAGTSEPDHPFKRPCVHERIDKVLRMLKPTVVVMCYGMNDGIYQPPSQKIFAAYKDGMLRLAKKIKATHAMLIVMTPPPFEPEAIESRGKKFGPNANGNFAWNAPARNYDDTVKAMSDWCMTNPFDAYAVVDLRTPLLELLQQKIKEDPEFLLTGDGVHFNDAAHDAVANALLAQLPLGSHGGDEHLTEKELEVAIASNQLLRDAYLSATGKNRPGLKAGLPVVIAERQAAALRETIAVPEPPQ